MYCLCILLWKSSFFASRTREKCLLYILFYKRTLPLKIEYPSLECIVFIIFTQINLQQSDNIFMFFLILRTFNKETVLTNIWESIAVETGVFWSGLDPNVQCFTPDPNVRDPEVKDPNVQELSISYLHTRIPQFPSD